MEQTNIYSARPINQKKGTRVTFPEPSAWEREPSPYLRGADSWGMAHFFVIPKKRTISTIIAGGVTYYCAEQAWHGLGLEDARVGRGVAHWCDTAGERYAVLISEGSGATYVRAEAILEMLGLAGDEEVYEDYRDYWQGLRDLVGRDVSH